MAIFDDPGKRLRDMERELKAVAPEDGPEADERIPWAPEAQEVYYQEDHQRDLRKARETQKPQKSRGCATVLLALVEILVIAGMIGGWLLWHK